MNMEIFIGTCLSVAIIFSLIGFLVFIWFIVKFKRQKKVVHQAADQLKIGNEVLFGGGIYGKVTKILNDDCLMVEVSKGVNIEVSRYSVQAVVSQ